MHPLFAGKHRQGWFFLGQRNFFSKPVKRVVGPKRLTVRLRLSQCELVSLVESGGHLSCWLETGHHAHEFSAHPVYGSIVFSERDLSEGKLCDQCVLLALKAIFYHCLYLPRQHRIHGRVRCSALFECTDYQFGKGFVLWTHPLTIGKHGPGWLILI